MNQVCNVDTPFNKTEIGSTEFLTRAGIVLIPVIVGGILIYNSNNWFNDEVISPDWAPSTSMRIIIAIIIAIIITYIWYRMSMMCINRKVIDLLFLGFLFLSLIFMIVLFNKHDIKTASFVLLLLTLLSLYITYYIWKIQKSGSVLFIFITLWLAYMTAVFYNSKNE